METEKMQRVLKALHYAEERFTADNPNSTQVLESLRKLVEQVETSQRDRDVALYRDALLELAVISIGGLQTDRIESILFEGLDTTGTEQ